MDGLFLYSKQWCNILLLCQKCSFKLRDCRSRLTQALNESSEEKEVTSVRDWGRESKQMREKAREKGCLCLDMGGMRNRGLLWKNFLLFLIVHTGFYPGEIRRTWLQQYKHDQVQFSSQSPDSKYNHIRNSTIYLVVLYLLPSFPSDTPYLAYPKVSYQFPQWKQVPQWQWPRQQS